jgi:hypothetical protein
MIKSQLQVRDDVDILKNKLYELEELKVNTNDDRFEKYKNVDGLYKIKR